MTLFPVVPVDSPSVLTDQSHPLSFLIGSNGLFRKTVNPFFVGVTQVETVPGLEKVPETARILAPRIPQSLLRQVEAFFTKVYSIHQSEAVVVLLCHPVLREWRVFVPKQRVIGLSVSYDKPSITDLPEGFVMIGSIHSHGSVGAFHSGTDDKDEQFFEGLHITIGNVDTGRYTYSCRWIIATKAFKTEIADVLDVSPVTAVPDDWLAQVTKRETDVPDKTTFSSTVDTRQFERREEPAKEGGKKRKKPKTAALTASTVELITNRLIDNDLEKLLSPKAFYGDNEAYLDFLVKVMERLDEEIDAIEKELGVPGMYSEASPDTVPIAKGKARKAEVETTQNDDSLLSGEFAGVSAETGEVVIP